MQSPPQAAITKIPTQISPPAGQTKNALKRCQKEEFFVKLWNVGGRWLLTALITVGLLFALCGKGHAAEVTPKYVALTFDDGPKGRITETLLDSLQARGVHATFFLIGNLAEQYPGLVQRMDREGHQIGLHSYDHLASLAGLTRDGFEAQIGRSRQIIQEALGKELDLMLRPPYGQVDDNLRAWCGCPLVLWSVDPEDWYYQDPAKETLSVCQVVKDGDIILLHDTFDETVEAALSIIDQLHQEGYYFVTVNELLEMQGVTPQNGVCYYSAFQSR